MNRVGDKFLTMKRSLQKLLRALFHSAVGMAGIKRNKPADQEMSERTTSAGLWRFSWDYLKAAAVVAEANQGRFSAPVHFLYGHSIELALKAFLATRGISVTDLRFKYGHNLKKLLKEARRRGLTNECDFSQAETNVVFLLNEQYARKNHEYIVTGVMTVPNIFALTLVATRLATSLRKCCINHTYPGTE